MSWTWKNWRQKQRAPILHRGVVVKLKRAGVIVALLERSSERGWNCLVVGGNSPTYRPGVYDIFVFDSDLAEAEVVNL